jgi:hypothetical protein
MSNNTKKDNVVNIDFGTTQPNKQEIDEKQLEQEMQVMNTLLVIGQSTLEWAMYAKREDFIKHMNELYDAYHPEDKKNSGIIVPNNDLILPN